MANPSLRVKQDYCLRSVRQGVAPIGGEFLLIDKPPPSLALLPSSAGTPQNQSPNGDSTQQSLALINLSIFIIKVVVAAFSIFHSIRRKEEVTLCHSDD